MGNNLYATDRALVVQAEYKEPEVMQSVYGNRTYIDPPDTAHEVWWKED
jgi:hypothetical protein